MSISIILPCYNEAATIRTTIDNVTHWLQKKSVPCEIIAVNDGSKDATLAILQSLAEKNSFIKVVHLEKNQGYGNALIAGLDMASYDAIGFMDSDGQFKAEDFDILLPHLESFPIVTGRRIRRADPFIRSVNAFLYGSLVKIALRVFVRDINCGMKVFRKNVWPQIRPKIASGALFNAEVFLRAQGEKLTWKQVPVPHYPRTAGAQTGAKITVILRMFAELFILKRKYTQELKAK